ncbi:hypothetical protein CCP2SC5_1310003 [Azospirillaceae bacterium]
MASVRINGQISGSDFPNGAELVLEPKDGGDARVEGPGVYLVEQYRFVPTAHGRSRR